MSWVKRNQAKPQSNQVIHIEGLQFMFGRKAGDPCPTPNCNGSVYGDGWDRCEDCLKADAAGSFQERVRKLAGKG